MNMSMSWVLHSNTADEEHTLTMVNRTYRTFLQREERSHIAPTLPLPLHYPLSLGGSKMHPRLCTEIEVTSECLHMQYCSGTHVIQTLSSFNKLYRNAIIFCA